MARSMHRAVAHLDAFSNAARNLAHVGESLEGLVVRRNTADLQEELLDSRLQERHDLGCDFPDLIILWQE